MFCAVILNHQTRTTTQKTQTTAMKKNVTKLNLKTDKIVSLSKTDAQAIIGGAKSGKTAAVLSVCWCND